MGQKELDRRDRVGPEGRDKRSWTGETGWDQRDGTE